MAFRLNTTPLHVPRSTEGIYILPYTWFEYGIRHGHLVIEDLSFYDTVQGSMYALAKHEQLPIVCDFGSGDCDVWLMYKPGTQEVNVIAELQKDAEDYYLYTDIVTPQGKIVRYLALEGVLKDNIQDQKDYNRALVQLLKGCRVKLVRSVWKVNL